MSGPGTTTMTATTPAKARTSSTSPIVRAGVARRTDGVRPPGRRPSDLRAGAVRIPVREQPRRVVLPDPGMQRVEAHGRNENHHRRVRARSAARTHPADCELAPRDDPFHRDEPELPVRPRRIDQGLGLQLIHDQIVHELLVEVVVPHGRRDDVLGGGTSMVSIWTGIVDAAIVPRDVLPRPRGGPPRSANRAPRSGGSSATASTSRSTRGCGRSWALIFLPWTTLAYVLVWSPVVGVDGGEWIVVALGFVADVATYSSRAAQARYRASRA